MSDVIKVLLVEDNRLAGMLAESILKTCGCQVQLAGSGELALSCFDGSQDIIFMDLGLPGMDGFETAEKLRQLMQDKFTPIIALTANVDAEHRERCKKAGINGILMKPADRNALRAVLDKYIKSCLTSSTSH